MDRIPRRSYVNLQKNTSGGRSPLEKRRGTRDTLLVLISFIHLVVFIALYFSLNDYSSSIESGVVDLSIDLNPEQTASSSQAAESAEDQKSIQLGDITKLDKIPTRPSNDTYRASQSASNSSQSHGDPNVATEDLLASSTSTINSKKRNTRVFSFEFSRNRQYLWKVNLTDIHSTSAFQQSGSIVAKVDSVYKTLCEIGVTKHCYTNYIADSIDLAVAFSPLYAYRQERQKDIYILHDYFTAMLLGIGIRTQVIEAIMPSRNQTYKRTTAGHEPWEIQITIEDSFYYRENLLNVAARKTLDIWEYMFWIDAHQVFENIYWWEEAIYHMEHVSAVHLTQRMNYYDNKNKTVWLTLETATYAYTYRSYIRGTDYFAGNGWGMSKEAYLRLGHIIDECVAASCDYALVIALMKNNDDWDGINKFPYYYKQLKPLIEAARPKLEGKYKTLRGRLYHIDHVHVYDYAKVEFSFSRCCINLDTDLRRDENFTLHSTNQAFKNHFPA